MEGRAIDMIRWFIRSFRAVIVVPLMVLGGCMTAAPQLEVTRSNLVVGRKLDRPVSLVLSDASLHLNQIQTLDTPCFPVAYTPTPMGEIFRDTMLDRLRAIYEDVTLAAAPQAGRLSFVVDLQSVGRRNACALSPQTRVEVKGAIRAYGPEGDLLWTGVATRAERIGGMVMRLDYGKAVGEEVSEALAKLVEQWSREILANGDLKTGMAVASGGGSDRAGSRSGAGDFPTRPLKLSYKGGPRRPDDIAVIIGNADYQRLSRDIPDVKPAYADANSFKRYAMEQLGIREGNIIELKDATGAQMARVFGNEREPRGQLYDWVRPGRSNVIIYYAGHGAPGGREGEAYLVPADADAARIEINGYALATLYGNLAQIPARSVTVVLESCFSGASQGGSVISNASPVYLRTDLPDAPERLTVISAGRATDLASWEEDGSHGLFTKYYLTGMSGAADKAPYGNGDGSVGFRELELYLDDTLTYYARRYYGRDQKAQFHVARPGAGS